MAQLSEETDLKVDDKEKTETQPPWKTILYNDEVHTFDEVIMQIIKATGCSLEKAKMLTLQVHFNGKAMVYAGELQKCLEVSSILQEIELITEIEG